MSIINNSHQQREWPGDNLGSFARDSISVSSEGSYSRMISAQREEDFSNAFAISLERYGEVRGRSTKDDVRMLRLGDVLKAATWLYSEKGLVQELVSDAYKSTIGIDQNNTWAHRYLSACLIEYHLSNSANLRAPNVGLDFWFRKSIESLKTDSHIRAIFDQRCQTVLKAACALVSEAILPAGEIGMQITQVFDSLEVLPQRASRAFLLRALFSEIACDYTKIPRLLELAKKSSPQSYREQIVLLELEGKDFARRESFEKAEDRFITALSLAQEKKIEPYIWRVKKALADLYFENDKTELASTLISDQLSLDENAIKDFRVRSRIFCLPSY